MKTGTGLQGCGNFNVFRALLLRRWASLTVSFGITCAGIFGVITTSRKCAWAQVISDETLGAESSQVTSPTAGDFLIEGGATRGGNLFHSFSQFSIPSNGIAYFNNALNIENIISRVTGGSISNIDGIIAANGTANIFLLNPNSILFGPNASLDIGGSFIGSTGNSLIFADGTQFNATSTQTPPLLTISVPLGLQYGDNPGNIQVQNSNFILQVPDGQTLALVGGSVQLNGAFLQAPGGRIELGAVAGAGTIGIEIDNDNGSARLNFPQGIARADVSFNNAEIDVVAGEGGSVAIYGQNLTLDSSIIRAGIGQNLGSIIPQAGDIILDGIGTVSIGEQSIIANVVFRGFTGNSGNINIKARALQLTDGTRVGTFVFGEGNAGQVVVQAEDSVLLTGDGTILASNLGQRAVGQAGDITIQTDSLVLTDDAQIGAITSGQGNAGKILIQARDSVSLAGRLTGILSNVGLDAVGQGGDINIQTDALSVTDGAALTASTFGQGDAGSIAVNANQSIALADGYIQSTVQEEAIGQGGAINIQTGLFTLSDGAFVDSSLLGQGSGGSLNIQTDSLFLTQDALLSAGTFGEGNAGNIRVRANDSISLTNSNIFTVVSPESVGQGGDIDIQANTLTLTEQSFISSNTFGQGKSGNIQVQVNESVVLAQTSGIATGVDSEAVGDGGNISVKTRLLSLSDGSQLFAGTFGQGKSGDIQVDASESVRLSGVAPDGFSTGLFTSTEEEARGSGGDITVSTGVLTVSNGAVLSAITGSPFNGGSINVDAKAIEITNGGQLLTTAFSSGDAGDIRVNANQSMTLTGSDPTFASRLDQFGADVVDNDGAASGLYARTQGDGTAGNITINTPLLSVKDRAQISASTSGGAGGSITVTAKRFEALDGAQLRTTTAGSSNAGNIALQVVDDVTLAGADSGLFANTDPGSSGNGGSIFISNPQTIVMQDGATIAVDSNETGEGGNIQLQAGSLTLSKNAEISAETASNTGGNINLEVQDLLLVRHGSRISTTAGTAQAGGDGGNIKIDAQFIVAIPKENSDITANAFTGRGGNINITTQGIYGLQFRPRLTPLSDITASSEFGVDGTVQINGPDVDPSRGLVNLPNEPVNLEVAQGCQAAGEQASVEFFNTGRGGLAPNPYEPLSSSNIWEDVPSSTQRGVNSTRASASPTTPPNKIVEAQGWMINEKGEIVLVAQMPLTQSQTRCRLR
jgi:filamentous hemagglutinin family protein